MAKERLCKRNNVVLKIMSGVAGIALVGCIAAGPLAQPAAAADTSGYVTAAATRAAGPAPEILGITGVEESGQFVTLLGDDNVPQYEWEQPKYYLFGNTLYNTLANPYFVNAANSIQDEPRVVYNASRAGGGYGPNASLGAYGKDEDSGGDATDDAVWELLPDIIIGTGGNTDYDDSADAVESALKLATGSYNPTSIEYTFDNYSEMIEFMYELAEEGDASATNGKTLRYGSAVTIATKYEAYIRGIQGYILSQIEADNAKANANLSNDEPAIDVTKTVASVSAYNSATDTFTLRASEGTDGTASQNRYLETCLQVANNYVTGESDITISASALASANIDLILVGGQQGDSTADQETILNRLREIGYNEANQNIYYVTDTTAGSAYGVVMNSVENAQNIGRILGVLYSEYVDQDQLVAYYYANFYHIITGENNATLAYVIGEAMQGVLNYDATSGDYTEWTDADGSDYSESYVLTRINNGLDYIRDLDDVPEALELSEYLSDDGSDEE